MKNIDEARDQYTHVSESMEEITTVVVRSVLVLKKCWSADGHNSKREYIEILKPTLIPNRTRQRGIIKHIIK